MARPYQFWQVDRGDVLPLGKPELMMSFTRDEQVSVLARREGVRCAVW